MKHKDLYRAAEKYIDQTTSFEERYTFDEFLKKTQEANKEMLISMGRSRRERIFNGVIEVTGGHQTSHKIIFRYVAAASIIIALISVGFISKDLFSTNYIVHKTQKGERKVITLNDGSVITLNAGTTLRYPEEFNRKNRSLELNGEAFFKVAHDPGKPFIVKTSTLQTTVLGTSFNINAYSDKEARVSVNTGKVEVNSTIDPETAVVLLPNEQVYYSDKLMSISSEESKDYSAWTKNTIVLKNKSLQEAARVFENWYAVKISFGKKALKELRINGKYRDENLENIFRSIETLKGVQIDTLNTKHFIIREKTGEN